MSTATELATARLWSRSRIVVVDTETTGKRRDSRIIDIALLAVEDGAVTGTFNTLLNPALSRIGAQDIHHITPEMLEGKPTFEQEATRIRAILTSETKQVLLLGHNVTFDAKRLMYEFARLGEELPPVLLLDTKKLLPAFKVGSYHHTLADFCSLTGVTNRAPHTALGDATATWAVTKPTLSAVLADGINDLTPYATTLPEEFLASLDDDLNLTEAHTKFHTMPLTNARTRVTSLEGCLAENCRTIHHRVADDATTPAAARTMHAWATSRLTDTSLTRVQTGLLAATALRALEAWRDELKTPNPTVILTAALATLAATTWTACDATTGLCDRCENPDPNRRRTCRFIQVPGSLVWLTLHTKTGGVPETVAVKYLYGTAKTPCGRSTWYAQVAVHSPSAAVRGAATAAQALRGGKYHDTAHTAVKALWKAGERSPQVTEVLAAFTEDNPQGLPVKQAWQNAISICDTGLTAAQPGQDWTGVRAKRDRLTRRLNKTQAEEARDPYNKRPPRQARFVKP